MDKFYVNIYKYGTYYNPAQNHYDESVVVNCDRCLKKDLIACIGWKESDLCLECASVVDNLFYNEELGCSE